MLLLMSPPINLIKRIKSKSKNKNILQLWNKNDIILSLKKIMSHQIFLKTQLLHFNDASSKSTE